MKDWEDLKARLVRAAEWFEDEPFTSDEVEQARRKGRAEGIRMALDYMRTYE